MTLGTEQFTAMTAEQALIFANKSAAIEEPVYKRLAEIVGPTATVLDLGCGKAEFAARYFTLEQYTGIDCSEALITVARATNPGYHFAIDDGASGRFVLPNGDPFDYTIVKSVLEHIPEEEAVAFYDTARKSARCALIAWHMEPRAGKAFVRQYDGELGKMLQIRHRRVPFGGKVLAKEYSGSTHVIWTVADEINIEALEMEAQEAEARRICGGGMT